MKILGFNFRPLLSSVDFKAFVSVLPPSLSLSKTVGFIPRRLTRLGPSKFSEIKSNLALIRLGRDLFDSNSNSNSKFK